MRVICVALVVLMLGHACLGSAQPMLWEFLGGTVASTAAGIAATYVTGAVMLRSFSEHLDERGEEPGSIAHGYVALAALTLSPAAFPIGAAIGAPLGVMLVGRAFDETGNMGLCWIGSAAGVALGAATWWFRVGRDMRDPLALWTLAVITPAFAGVGATIGFNVRR